MYCKKKEKGGEEIQNEGGVKQKKTSMDEELEVKFEIDKPVDDPLFAILLFHGYTSIPKFWDPTVKLMLESPPLRPFKDRILVVRAAAPIKPTILYGGYPRRTFYNFYGRNHGMEEDRDGIEKTNSEVHLFMRKLMHKYSLTTKQLILMGFSQGGAVALKAGTTFPGFSGLIIALSTYYPLIDEFRPPVDTKYKILYMHGKGDKVLPFGFAERNKNHFKDHCVNFEFVEMEDQGHEIRVKQLRESVIPFIAQNMNLVS